MKYALIDPTTTVQHISSWTDSKPPQPIIETYPNSVRVAEVSESPFDIALPLFWTECDDSVMADQWYYIIDISQFNPIENAPAPKLDQPVVNGVQTL